MFVRSGNLNFFDISEQATKTCIPSENIIIHGIVVDFRIYCCLDSFEDKVQIQEFIQFKPKIELVAMIQELQTFKQFGYNHAKLWLENTTYSPKNNWNNLMSNLPYDLNLKFIMDPKESNATQMTIGGLELYLSRYLALALNATMTFVKTHRFEKEQATGMYTTLTGDVLAQSDHRWTAVSPTTGTVRPIDSPIFSVSGMAMISCKELKSLKIADVIHIFQLKVSKNLIFKFLKN